MFGLLDEPARVEVGLSGKHPPISAKLRLIINCLAAQVPTQILIEAFNIVPYTNPRQIKQVPFIILQIRDVYSLLNFLASQSIILIEITRMSVGTVSDLVNYLNLNRHILEKERSNIEHMQRIMSMLSHQNMEILQREFQLYPKGLELPTFIYLMKRLYTPENEISKYYFVSDLIKFFQAIDINGDGHLEWSEFTEYIIENIRRIEKPNYKNKGFQENEVISSAYSKISNEYKITQVIDPGTLNCIKKIIYIPKDDRYYLLETGSNLIRIYASDFTLIDYLEINSDTHSSFIVDFAFDKYNMIFGAIFQGSARFCNLKSLGNVKTCNECQVKKLSNYHKLEYLPLHKYWAFLSKNGELRLSKANYRSRTALEYNPIICLKQHQSLVTDIVEIQEPQYIATSSMDGNVKFYSVHLKKNVTLQHIGEQTSSAINGRQKKGILGIDYTREFGSYFLSWGFSSSIFVYALQVSLAKGFTGKYKQHCGNLLTARFLKSFPYVLSFDDKLSMRIWDFRRFQTIQIINCEKNFINPSRLQIIPELSECLVCEKKITQFRAPSLEKKSRQINEFHFIFDFRVCSNTNCIFLFTSNDVRVYNLVTGNLQKVFTKLHDQQNDTHITAAEFGYKNRKFFVGDAAGFVREYCSQTGQFLQEVQPGEQNHYENKGIVKIIFLREHSLLIVCSLDGRILIYERDSESQFQLIRDIRDTHYELTAAEASARYCVLSTGSDDGTVNIWNLQKLALDGVLVLKSKIVNIAFSPIHPIMIVAEEKGYISFFYIRPQEDPNLRNKCFVKLANIEPLGQLKKIKAVGFELVIKAYIKNENKLVQDEDDDYHLICVIGDDQGRVELVNLSSILKQFKIEQNHQIFSIKKSIKCQTHSMKAAVNNQRKKVQAMGYSNEGVPEINLTQFQSRISFDAHKQSVQRVAFSKQNSMVVTTSADEKKVKVWNLEGDLNGAIDFFTFKKSTWRVGEINFYKKLQAIDTTIYSMKLIENKKLQPQQQEFIRVNLLLNQYMDAQQKEEYLQWIGVLKRTRSRARIPRPKMQDDDQFDARDEAQKLKNINNKKMTTQSEQEGTIEFNQIYNNLVAKIKTRIDRSELPSIVKKDIKEEPKERIKQREGGINEFMTVLRRTLRGGQEQEKRFEKEFGAIMKRGKEKKKACNMLYQSLGQVRRNIAAMQKKNKVQGKKFL